MIHLTRSTAIAVVLGATAFAAHAQNNANTENEDMASAPTYCDTQWVNVDGNSDGFVSKDEASGAVDNRFSAIDADGNGEITKTEYVDCMTRTGGQQSAEVTRDEQSFTAADADSDDSLTRNEFRDASKQAYDDSQSATQSDAEPIVVLRRFVWLTPEESQNDSTLRDMSADEAASRSAKTFAALDKNSDNILDTEEWSQRSPASGIDEQWANAKFDELDEDQTNSISRDEYRSAQSKMIDEMSTASTGDASGEQTDGQQNADQQSASGDAGIPVYEYRFWTF